MESFETIINWHEETFPEATFEGQKKKFEEEETEWLNASEEDKLWELADMFIVACGIARFDCEYALQCFASVNDKVDDWEAFGIAIIEKMKVNKKRQWSKGNGEYKHIGADNG